MFSSLNSDGTFTCRCGNDVPLIDPWINRCSCGRIYDDAGLLTNPRPERARVEYDHTERQWYWAESGRTIWWPYNLLDADGRVVLSIGHHNRTWEHMKFRSPSGPNPVYRWQHAGGQQFYVVAK